MIFITPNNMNKYLSIAFVLCLCSISGFAQNQVNQAMFNQNLTYYNPAYSGFHESNFTAAIISRADWVNFRNVANTSNPWNAGIALDKRFDEKKIGVGVNITSNNIGRVKSLDMVGNFAYHLSLSEQHKFSFATKFGVNYVNLDIYELRNQEDVTFSNAQAGNYFLPKIGFGVAYKSEHAFAGIAVPDLIVKDSKNILVSNGLFSNINVNLNAGYKFELNDDYYLQPSLLTSYNANIDTKCDLNFIAGKNEAYWGGVSYAINKSYAAMAGVMVSGRLSFSYAFTFHSEMVVNPTSHEICLHWDLEDANF